MTQVSIDWCGGDSYVLTDEHSASSYGMGVLVRNDDEIFGPADAASPVLDGWFDPPLDAPTGGAIVKAALAAHIDDWTADQKALAERFLNQVPQ